MSDYQIDFDRKQRLGFPEVIYGASKSSSVLSDILAQHKEQQENALITKLSQSKADYLLEIFPEAFYCELSGIFVLNGPLPVLNAKDVAVISAGTSDLGVATEAAYTLSFMSYGAERINDVGVAGIHRLMEKLEYLKQFKVLIVIAGFEGALPSVVGGLFPQPIIAVPTSVGYGASHQGHTALNAMLASCANGISVVNIDNGYGAAMAATRILTRVHL